MRWRVGHVGRLVLVASMATTAVVAASAESASAAAPLNPHVQVQGSPACRSNSASELWKLYDGPTPLGAFQIADAPNQEMFVATANAVYHNYNDPNSGPVGWSTLGGPPSGIFGSVRNGTNYLSNQELYVRATNGQVYHLYSTPGQGSGWQGWDTLGAPATRIVGDVYEGTNYLRNQELYVLGADGNVYHKFSTPGAGTGWSNWDTMSHPAGVTLTGDVQIGINYRCDQEIYVTGTDGNVYHKFATPGVGTGWSEWDSMGHPAPGLIGSVTAGENFVNSQELFVIGKDGQVYHDFSTPGIGSGWSGWGSLGAPSGMNSTPVIVDTYPQEKLTVTTNQKSAANPTGIFVDVATPGQGTGWTGWFDPSSAPPIGTLVNPRHGPAVSVRTPPFAGLPTSYAYVPSVMIDGSQYKMWYCGSPADTISYSTSGSPGGPWSTPVGVFGASGAPGKFDAALTCDPSVIKVNGTYYMYYGGSPGSTPPGGFGTQGVGLATSTDGVNWQRANNGDPVRTPRNSSQVARPGCVTNSYGAGQPSALFNRLDGQFYLLYEDTSSQASTCTGSTGVYVIRSADPTFQSGVQVLTANGWPADSASTKASFQLGNGFVSADWMYSDTMGRYLLVINGNGGTKNTELYQFGPDFKEVVKVTNIPVFYDWSEGPGLARTPDGHAPAQTLGSPQLVPIDLFYSTGAISSTGQSDIVTSGVDISAGPG